MPPDRAALLLAALPVAYSNGQAFQTRLHLPARTDDLFVSVVIRGFRRVNLACASGSGRIEADGSVRVELESIRAVRTARIRRRRRTHRATRVEIPDGIRTLVAQALAAEIHGQALAA